ncbi:MAG TPA: NUDIX domain-containing protein [Candidatus Saccharimonadales bacterium]|nr:NUDIX domain-containing protein [Candidatus Saccharimonadales bacterium]
MTKLPGISVDILVMRAGHILLGLMTDQWRYEGQQVYGVPGRDIHFGERMGETVKRNIKEEFDCNVTTYKIISVNANYALGNHFIGVGVVAEMDGEPKVILRDDWVKWEWFAVSDIPSNLFPAAQNLIDSYLQQRITVAE